MVDQPEDSPEDLRADRKVARVCRDWMAAPPVRKVAMPGQMGQTGRQAAPDFQADLPDRLDQPEPCQCRECRETRARMALQG